MSKSILLILSLLSLHFFLQAQEDRSILIAPTDWNREIIELPLSFAPEIALSGIEDVAFAPGWSKAGAEDFWTYKFVWNLEDPITLSETYLEEMCRKYYDGLMLAVMGGPPDNSDSLNMEKTLATFIASDGGYLGKVKVFDAFTTKEMLTLYFKVDELHCKGHVNQIIVFDISPKALEDEIWRLFEEVKFKVECK